MAGILPPRPRLGNRLEYLAHYILSAFGTAVPVLRTEDVGVDFYCALGKDEPIGITIANSYAVQLKSGKNPCLEFGGKTGGKKWVWRDYEIKWFLNLEHPLLFGVPHKKEKRLDLYSTSLVRFITYEKSKLPYAVKIWPGQPGKSKGHIHPDLEGKSAIRRKIPKNCDGRIYNYKLGPPIISCTLDDLNSQKRIASFQKRLQKLLETERLNNIFRALGLPYWTWVLEVETNKWHKLAFAYDEDRTTKDRQAVLTEIVPFICALALSYKKEKNTKKLEALKGIAKQLPKKRIPQVIRNELAVLFG